MGGGGVKYFRFPRKGHTYIYVYANCLKFTPYRHGDGDGAVCSIPQPVGVTFSLLNSATSAAYVHITCTKSDNS